MTKAVFLMTPVHHDALSSIRLGLESSKIARRAFFVPL
jgi:hypothetical protein